MLTRMGASERRREPRSTNSERGAYQEATPSRGCKGMEEATRVPHDKAAGANDEASNGAWPT